MPRSCASWGSRWQKRIPADHSPGRRSKSRYAAGVLRRPRQRLLAALAATLLLAGSARAQTGDDTAELGATATAASGSAEEARGQSSTTVTRRQMEHRVARSTPDALLYEPGVSVQQTAHGQASPYVRGMTGQQVAHIYDGVRMNNGIYRQGPNQYFFVVDSHTLSRIDVVRGSASTHYGSDALGGALLATPRAATPDPDMELRLAPRLTGRHATVDGELGGRAELEGVFAGRTGLLAGVGYRELGKLESAGVAKNPGRPAPLVPSLAADGRTPRGTGFDELTFDARLTHQLREGVELTGAIYGFRELDSPRTDQCPPPEAPISECLVVEEQFRTLAYAALRGDAGDHLRGLDLNVSYQRHDELRVRHRPDSGVRATFDNRIDTLGASFRARTREYEDGGVRWLFRYGAEGYRDELKSGAVQRFTDEELIATLGEEALTFEQSRGQYLDGSTYLTTGLFGELELSPLSWLTLRGGGRLAATGANAPRDPVSGSSAVSQRWGTAVARAGSAVTLHPDVVLQLNYDQGFRAPNLDDLTSRQQVGPGFQFENSELQPETTDTFEAGLRVTPGWLDVESWVFATLLDNGITRAVREQDDCPPETAGCRASRNQFQLINADGTTVIWGADGGVTARIPGGLSLRATYAWTWGEAPNTGSRSTSGNTPFGERVPVSRIPPLMGTAELHYRHRPSGLYGGAALRWARAQTRLAPSDIFDARIPDGGTPGYRVVVLRAGYRLPPHLRVSFVVENLLDEPFRIHGSSINGPGRGVIVEVSVGY